jgi:hypothetical protein
LVSVVPAQSPQVPTVAATAAAPTPSECKSARRLTRLQAAAQVVASRSRCAESAVVRGETCIDEGVLCSAASTGPLRVTAVVINFTYAQQISPLCLYSESDLGSARPDFQGKPRLLRPLHAGMPTTPRNRASSRQLSDPHELRKASHVLHRDARARRHDACAAMIGTASSPSSTIRYPADKGKDGQHRKPARRALPNHLPRERVVHAAPAF